MLGLSGIDAAYFAVLGAWKGWHRYDFFWETVGVGYGCTQCRGYGCRIGIAFENENGCLAPHRMSCAADIEWTAAKHGRI